MQYPQPLGRSRDHGFEEAAARQTIANNHRVNGSAGNGGQKS
jgi:hypothetical protein